MKTKAFGKIYLTMVDGKIIFKMESLIFNFHVFSSYKLFIGSIPFGYLIYKSKNGDDIRKHGSGNIGATNVNRLMGKS